MKYKVFNLFCDMKYLKNGLPVEIKRGKTVSVTQKEYQYLSQVYGMTVKGTEDITVRITQPVAFEQQTSVVNTDKNKKRKSKKVRAL